ncbi:uncharacterized protein LOC143446052 isoform X2 [Clavelina lepadiformis]|uniref:uncharacterized protein LOC143446052 isoform X2 n=1 Tax=Clavelina lepadiformis TaxID=159417 RepID=UPI004041DB9C
MDRAPRDNPRQQPGTGLPEQAKLNVKFYGVEVNYEGPVDGLRGLVFVAACSFAAYSGLSLFRAFNHCLRFEMLVKGEEENKRFLEDILSGVLLRRLQGKISSVDSLRLSEFGVITISDEEFSQISTESQQVVENLDESAELPLRFTNFQIPDGSARKNSFKISREIEHDVVATLASIFDAVESPSVTETSNFKIGSCKI